MWVPREFFGLAGPGSRRKLGGALYELIFVSAFGREQYPNSGRPGVFAAGYASEV